MAERVTRELQYSTANLTMDRGLCTTILGFLFSFPLLLCTMYTNFLKLHLVEFPASSFSPSSPRYLLENDLYLVRAWEM